MAISSTPKACGVGWLLIIRAAGAHLFCDCDFVGWKAERLLRLCLDGAGDFVPQITEVVLTDLEAEHFLNHR